MERTKYRIRVGAIHESPAVSAPSERGLSNAQHLTGGEIFPFLSPSVTPYGVPPADGGGLPLSLRDISLTL